MRRRVTLTPSLNIGLYDFSDTTYTLGPTVVTNLPSWKNGTFCDHFIGHTLRTPLAMCSSEINETDSLKCFGSPESNKMAMCSVQYLAMEPKKLQRVVTNCDTCAIPGSGSFYLIANNLTQCSKPDVSILGKHVEEHDIVYRSMKEMASNRFVSLETCNLVVNKTAYFFHSQRYHIYFRFYSYYNLYKTLLDTQAHSGDYIIVRMAEGEEYKFDKFERSIFPELTTPSELPDKRVCFRNAVFAPWTYASVPFRCKMDSATKERCLECKGDGLLGTSLISFRTRALQACHLEDQTPKQRMDRETRSIVFVKRKPYSRWGGDALSNFQRVLSNERELLTKLRGHFSNATVHDVFMEDMDICHQMQLVHECDVFIGVHGAGLVHAWWLQDDAALLELVPLSQARNPSFKTLATLAGRHFHTLPISGDKFHVSVDIDRTIKMIETISTL